MKKEAITVIKARRSVRAFKKEIIAKDIIEDIIDCGRLAPTANNIQPWQFVVVTDVGKREHIAEMTDYGGFIADAPVCIVVFCENTKYFLEDGCAAVENILLAVESYGLGACWVAGDKKSYAEEVKRFLKVPNSYKLVALIPIGYPAHTSSYSGFKKSLDKVLHWEEFENK